MMKKILAGLLTVGALAMAGAAWATPPGVTEKDGAFVAPDGKPLYTFARDTTPGKSACAAQCAAAWPALAADAAAKDDGDWTVVTRDDGAKQWAYKGKPLYLWVKDTKPGEVTGDGVNNVWHIAAP
jgi:predicted lipoprotein with Yx(FWY)xxD motif